MNGDFIEKSKLKEMIRLRGVSTVLTIRSGKLIETVKGFDVSRISVVGK